MLRLQNVGTLLVLALLAEAAAFIAVVHWIGIGAALLIGLGSTILGLARLRGLGSAALLRLRAVAEGRAGREDAFIDGALGAVGAVLLILPGFLSDLVGLALLAPSGRDWVRGRLGFSTGPLGGSRPERVRAASRPDIIDLEARDWSRLDRSRPN